MTSLSPDAHTSPCCETDIEIKLSQFEDKLDWSTLFGNSNPIEIELGCGKGRFIIRSAQENPGINYLGVEKSGKYSRVLKQRVLKSGVQNIRLLRGEAAYFITKFIPPASVQAFHIYFPDPWPKKRHHKRRLVNTGFVEKAKSSLAANGCIFYATDFEDYFNQMLDVSRTCKGIEEVFCKVVQPPEADPEGADTNYERKYMIQGRTIYKAAFKK
jgi:tRNA (guanine-N7-)-methyltransferase